MNRQFHIKEIVDNLREDLREETSNVLNLCTDEEIQSILVKDYNTQPLEIEFIFIKMLLNNRIGDNDAPGWELRNGALYDAMREREMPGIRTDKIDKLLE